MDLIMDTLYQKYKNSLYMVTLLMSIVFPCVNILLLQLSFFPSFILTLTMAAVSCFFAALILTVQKRE